MKTCKVFWSRSGDRRAQFSCRVVPRRAEKPWLRVITSHYPRNTCIGKHNRKSVGAVVVLGALGWRDFSLSCSDGNIKKETVPSRDNCARRVQLEASSVQFLINECMQVRAGEHSLQ